MKRAHRLSALVAVVATVLVSGFTATPASADMMSVCAPDIASLCSDVKKGRGRITACLVSHNEKLSTSCAPEVDGVARKGASRFAPKEVTTMMAPGFAAPIPASCQADSQTYCANVQPGDGRMFACLYARSDKVNGTCTKESRAALGG